MSCQEVWHIGRTSGYVALTAMCAGHRAKSWLSTSSRASPEGTSQGRLTDARSGARTDTRRVHGGTYRAPGNTGPNTFPAPAPSGQEPNSLLNL
jgi:hypothetical protein